MTPFSLAGRTALVTGARTGIGRAIADALSEAGATVIRHGHRPGDEWVLDLGVPGDIPAAAERLLRERRVDVLVNNAGIIRRAPAHEHSYDDWREVLTVDLDAVFLLCRAFGGPMLERGDGKIINIASMLSFQGGLTVPGYAAAKHGVAGLTKALANEWAGRGVNVNAIAPGYIETANTEALRADPDRDLAIRSRIPAGRWGRPEDLAGAAVFLASSAADYVHGHVLAVDGGWLAR
ncbi:SDR family oxidoreductase [Herbidospora sp. RD11066]